MTALVLLDLDGVVRQFDKSRVPAIEERFGLADGALRHEAFLHERGGRAVTGAMTRAQWIAEVGDAVGSLAAAKAWLDNWGTLDRQMHRIVLDVRAGGTPVALLTNGTDTIAEELAHLGVADDFDHVFCTTFMGVAKPDPAAFLHVAGTLQLDPPDVFFTDDSPTNVAAAAALGFDATHFVNAEAIRTALVERSVLPRA